MRRACLLPLLLLGSAASAQVAPPGTVALSDAEREAILSGNTEASAAAAQAGLGSGGPRPQVHGEMGVAIGSHGLRSVYGTAAVPLGDGAGAVVSFERSRYGR